MSQKPNVGGAMSRRISLRYAGLYVLLLDQLAEPYKSLVPLQRNQIQIAARLLKAPLLQLPEGLAPALFAAHETCSLQHAQVFADRLTRDAGALRQTEPVMDIGPPSHRRETSRKRVLSPRAAKRRAEPFEFLCPWSYGAWTRYFSMRVV